MNIITAEHHKNNILIPINHGLSSRYILRSNILNNLISYSNSNIIIAVANPNEFSDLDNQFNGRISFIQSPELPNSYSKKHLGKTTKLLHRKRIFSKKKNTGKHN